MEGDVERRRRGGCARLSGHGICPLKMWSMGGVKDCLLTAQLLRCQYDRVVTIIFKGGRVIAKTGADAQAP